MAENEGVPVNVNEQEIGIALDSERSLIPKGDQVADYVFRGDELQSLNLWDFICQVEKVRNQKKKPTDFLCSMEDDDDEFELEMNDDESSNDEHSESMEMDRMEDSQMILSLKGDKRPLCEFLDGHVESVSHSLRVCKATQRVVPVMIGPALPRCNLESNAAQYSRLMLMLFKPWRHAVDLKDPENDWESAFQVFLASPECDLHVRDIMNNMQLMHECKDSRDSHMKNRNRQPTGFVTSDMVDASQIAQEDELNESLHEEALHELLITVANQNSEKISRSSENVNGVLAHLESSGLCQTNQTSTEFSGDGFIELVDESNMDYEDLWKSAYDTRKTRWKERQIVLGTTAKPGDAVTSIQSKKKIGPTTQNAEQAP